MSSYNNFIPASQSENLMPLELPDCIHLTERYKCDILRVNKCIGEKCSFRQTSSDSKSSCDRWQKQMNAISDEEQKRIARAYYGGKMPWKEQ